MSVVGAECARKRKRNNETEEAMLDSVFNLFMDFTKKAEAIVPDQVQLDMFEKLQLEDQEDVIKEVFVEIVGNLLGKLPKEGKEAFLAKCFKELLKKLPLESRAAINAKVKDKTSKLIKATARPPTTYFPTDGLVEVGHQPELVRTQGPNVVRDDDDDNDDEEDEVRNVRRRRRY